MKSTERICRLSMLIGIALFFLILTGCETPAHRLDESSLKKIQPGVTTREEILKEFGKPLRTLGDKGNIVLFYERYFPEWDDNLAPKRPPEYVAISFLVGPEGRVLRTLYSAHEIEVHQGGGAAPLSSGAWINDEARAKIVRGKTTRQEMTSILGEPALESLLPNGDVEVTWLFLASKRPGHLQWLKTKLAVNAEFDEKEVVTDVRSSNFN